MLSKIKKFCSGVVSVSCLLKERVYMNSHNTKACSVIYDCDNVGDSSIALLLSYNKQGMIDGWDHSSLEFIHRKAHRLQEPLVVEVCDQYNNYSDIDIRVEENTVETQVELLKEYRFKLFTTKDITVRIYSGDSDAWVRSYPYNSNLATVILEALSEFCEEVGLSSIIDTGYTTSE